MKAKKIKILIMWKRFQLYYYCLFVVFFILIIDENLINVFFIMNIIINKKMCATDTHKQTNVRS